MASVRYREARRLEAQAPADAGRWAEAPPYNEATTSTPDRAATRRLRLFPAVETDGLALGPRPRGGATILGWCQGVLNPAFDAEYVFGWTEIVGAFFCWGALVGRRIGSRLGRE